MNVSGYETIEYSVCIDCRDVVAHIFGEDMDDATTSHIEQAIIRELDGREGHFSSGVTQTEDDPDGEGYDEFSWQTCELCRSTLGGSRHGVTLFVKEKAQ